MNIYTYMYVHLNVYVCMSQTDERHRTLTECVSTGIIVYHFVHVCLYICMFLSIDMYAPYLHMYV
jgi:heme/copper-type cytochrome/quinol oxidase subunit 4